MITAFSSARLSAVARVACVSLACSLVGGLAGCQTSRLDQLRDKSERVETTLKREQRRVLSLSGDDTRQARLDHLTQLRGALSATDIALSTVPLFFSDLQQRTTAYDVLDEAYDTIEWNIPLAPDQPKRAMPAQLQGSALRLQ